MESDSTLRESRVKSEGGYERCAPAMLIHASRHASHSWGRMLLLHAASGKGARGGRGPGLVAIMSDELRGIIYEGMLKNCP